MKLATDQAAAILAADPFVIVRVVIDKEGYLDFDFEPITVATNVMWDAKELDRFVKDEQEAYSEGLSLCQATYLCHLERDQDDAPSYHPFWSLTEAVLLGSEPFDPSDEARGGW